LRRPNSDKITGAEAPTGFAAKKPPISAGVRWTQRRKAALAIAVEAGRLGIEEASCRYNLTAEDFSGWQDSFHYFGMRKVKVGA